MNNRLKIILALVYVTLIALLMLNNCQGCSTPRQNQGQQPQEDPQNIGQDGDIKITLQWDYPGDVDLHVLQPNGVEISYRSMSDRSTGGRLDVDDREGGRGSAENIYWRNPPEGDYKVSVVYYRAIQPTGGPVTVTVKVNNEVRKFTANLSYEGEMQHIYTFHYNRPTAATPAVPGDSVVR